jgi:hypothetical protein
MGGVSTASITGYTYPLDISQLEWQLLNWTAAWRQTTTPADPFILDRMEYNRKTEKIHIYLNGKAEDATDENLKKSITKIASVFTERFPKVKIEEDFVVHYNLVSSSDQKATEIEYSQGNFSYK